MKPGLTIILLAGCLVHWQAAAGDDSPAPSKPMKGSECTIYSGELGDEKAPTKDERKLSIEVSGQAAKDIFDSIYPDEKVTCSGEKGERLRRKRDV